MTNSNKLSPISPLLNKKKFMQMLLLHVFIQFIVFSDVCKKKKVSVCWGEEDSKGVKYTPFACWSPLLGPQAPALQVVGRLSQPQTWFQGTVWHQPPPAAGLHMALSTSESGWWQYDLLQSLVPCRREYIILMLLKWQKF